MAQIDLSVVVPAFNEEHSIEFALINIDDVLSREKCNYEIIVIDDGSDDNTRLKALHYSEKNSRVKVVSYLGNNGKGYAEKNGFLKTNGDVVIFVDSDLEIDLKTVSNYIAALKNADIVIGSKWHSKSQVEISILRRTLSHCFNVLVKLLIGINIRDTQVGLKVVKKSSFEKIIPKLVIKRFAFDVELLAVSRLYGLTIIEMPVRLKMNNRPKFGDVLKMFFDLLGITYRVRVRRLYENPVMNQSGYKRRFFNQ
jgi:glycosyltransferase involved in cell wall biosynthesis